MGFLTLANVYTPPPILRGILPDAAKTAEPTLLADKGYDSLRSGSSSGSAVSGP